MLTLFACTPAGMKIEFSRLPVPSMPRPFNAPPRDQQRLIMGVPTPTGVVLPPPMAAGSSVNSSVNFLRLFDGTYHDPKTDHTGFLTPAELRLITEWIDIGAQYYNDPFVAPVAN